MEPSDERKNCAVMVHDVHAPGIAFPQALLVQLVRQLQLQLM